MPPISDKSGGTQIEAFANGFVIEPDDVRVFDILPRALYVGGAGDLNVTLYNGQQLLFKAVPVGTILPIRPKSIFATLTTASFLLGLY
jgi:hypothetical protein